MLNIPNFWFQKVTYEYGKTILIVPSLFDIFLCRKRVAEYILFSNIFRSTASLVCNHLNS